MDLDNPEISKFQEIDSWINDKLENRQKILEYLQKARATMGKRYKITNESLILRFFRFIVIKVSEKNVAFNIQKGRIQYKSDVQNLRVGAGSSRRVLLSIKDPFLRLDNHGYYLKEPEYFNRLIVRLKEFIFEASQGRLEDFITDT